MELPKIFKRKPKNLDHEVVQMEQIAKQAGVTHTQANFLAEDLAFVKTVESNDLVKSRE